MNKFLPIVLILTLNGCDVSLLEENEKKQQLSDSSKAAVTKGKSASPAVAIELPDLAKYSKMNEAPTEVKQTGTFENKTLLGKDAATIVKDLKVLLEKDKEEGIAAIEEVLQDPEDEVRRQTLALAYDEEVPVSKSTLHELALNDPNDRVRGTAALNIVNFGKPNEVREYLNEAVNDPNPVISRQAQLRLDKLDLQKQTP